ncbi:MAG: rRNA maturation RNase YbeY [Erysipelotrichaceae bacterium]|nr:rRNA maturation RNase YbeY [Erysipelotrichaceae bacterium]
MNCTVRNKTRDKQWKQYAPLFETIMSETLKTLKKTEEYAISIILVKKRKIHEINRDYRGIDRPTDVITFAAMEGEVFGMEDEIELGDIFINVDAVVDQAKEYGHSEKREIGFLFVHGLLHCFGYDHMNEEDEKEMTDLQKLILDPIVSRDEA